MDATGVIEGEVRQPARSAMHHEVTTSKRTVAVAALVGAVVTSLGLVGCGSDGDGGAAVRASASSAQPSGPPVVDELYDVGAGRRLRMRCAGTGSPTVLLDGGGGANVEDWPTAITQPLAARTRVCAYERAGNGRSDPAPMRPRGAVDVAGDLDALLGAAKIDGKLLLVGQSFGGAVVLNWALRHPDRTAGLVIADSDWPTARIDPRLEQLYTAEERAHFASETWDNPQNTERIDNRKIAAETKAAVRTLPGIPIRILSATKSAPCDGEPRCDAMRALSVELQSQWLKLSPTAVQVKVEAGHDLHEDVPDVVLREIETALAAITP